MNILALAVHGEQQALMEPGDAPVTRGFPKIKTNNNKKTKLKSFKPPQQQVARAWHQMHISEESSCLAGVPSMATCLSRAVDLLRYDTFKLMDAPDGGQTRAGGGNLLQELQRTQLSSNAEHVKLTRAAGYSGSHDPLLWHPTTRQTVLPNYSKTCRLCLPHPPRWLTERCGASLLLTWRPIAASLSNCLDGRLFSQATTASPGFFSLSPPTRLPSFFLYLGIRIPTTSGPVHNRASDPGIVEHIDVWYYY